VGAAVSDQIFQADEYCEFAFYGGRIDQACRQIRELSELQIAREKSRGGSVVGDRVSGKRKLRRLPAGLRLKVRKRHADKSNAFGRWKYRSDQVQGELM
jgi:hypothetical protein